MANQLRVTLISTELAYIVFAVSIFCSTNSYRQVEKCLYLPFYCLQIPRRIELYAGRER
jgi:hypothetical protein